jgi:hypothetical protein
VFPLASVLHDILEIGQTGMGCAVEIEFAVTFDDKNNVTIAILQLRPLVPSHEYSEQVKFSTIDKDRIFLQSDTALGNGTISTVRDIIYVRPETFDNTKTIDIAEEIGHITESLQKTQTPFVLIGPGRWGSQDRFLGIPVKWSQISGVKVMIETALKDFKIEPSQGTHFFHNIISRGIGYISIPYQSHDHYMDLTWIEQQHVQKKASFVKHIHLSQPLTIKLNGRKKNAMILKP